MRSSLSEDKTFQLEYNIYTQELSEEDAIKTGNTNIKKTIDKDEIEIEREIKDTKIVRLSEKHKYRQRVREMKGIVIKSE